MTDSTQSQGHAATDRRPAVADRRHRHRRLRDVLAVPDPEHSSYADGVLGPTLVLGVGLGLVFVPMSLLLLNHVDAGDAGVASTLSSVGQQVGGSIGLAVVGTVAWSAVASHLRSAAAAAAKAAVHVSGAEAAALRTQSYHQALATGFSRGFVVSAGMLALAMIVALAVVRVRRQDLAGADPGPKPAGDSNSPRMAG